MKTTKIDATIKEKNTLTITLDLHYEKNLKKKPIVIFCHGFKGFKDWGAWNLVAKEFAKNNFVFIKFNFSHNGTTENNLLDFENLQAFSENNYTKELDDLQKIIEWTSSKNFPLNKNEYDSNKIFLIGHSRGGGICIIKSFEEEKIQKFSTWASIDSFDRFGTEEQIKKWEKEDKQIFINGRTGQEMPIKYQFHKNYINNIGRLNIEKTLKRTNKSYLIVHGTKDPAVSFESAKNLHNWANNSILYKVTNADHVFNSKHPFKEEKLPKKLKAVVKKTIDFFSES